MVERSDTTGHRPHPTRPAPRRGARSRANTTSGTPGHDLDRRTGRDVVKGHWGMRPWTVALPATLPATLTATPLADSRPNAETTPPRARFPRPPPPATRHPPPATRPSLPDPRSPPLAPRSSLPAPWQRFKEAKGQRTKAHRPTLHPPDAITPTHTTRNPMPPYESPGTPPRRAAHRRSPGST